MISKPRMTKYCKRRVLTMQELASGLTERKTRSGQLYLLYVFRLNFVLSL